ncbi:glycosyltransferase family 4 protein [Aureimonas sp. AU12]|uniref:glycosyltransferase family 4 protein n=1 Tax=Aureimonas sp. AU12 TaxID=1638161 RepID=UPI000783D139|nr:glycosyltransferase family 4 protein [Aureimonas sp. AU12]
MRTALIAWDYPPSPSGLSTAAREIAESLALAGTDVTVFTLDRQGRSRQGSVTVVGCAIPDRSALAVLRRRGGLGHLAAPLAFRRAVLAEHRTRPFDLVEATNWYAPAVLLAGRRDLPLVTRNSTPAAYSRDKPRTMRDRFDAMAADRLEARQARGSAALLSNTAEHARRIAAEYGLAADERPHAVAGLSLPPATIARGAAALYRDPAPGEPVRLLFVGRAEHRKGFDMIMEAAAILDRESEAGTLPPFAIRLVGVPESDLPTGLAPAARARITALGRLAEAELALEYEAAHAVLSPSRYESFGLVYQEGIAYGRPMVACAVDASGREFVGDTGAGRMAASDTGAALADAVRPIIAEAGMRAELRANALRAAGRFNRETLGAETLALYRQALLRVSAGSV